MMTMKMMLMMITIIIVIIVIIIISTVMAHDPYNEVLLGRIFVIIIINYRYPFPSVYFHLPLHLPQFLVKYHVIFV